MRQNDRVQARCSINVSQFRQNQSPAGMIFKSIHAIWNQRITQLGFSHKIILPNDGRRQTHHWWAASTNTNRYRTSYNSIQILLGIKVFPRRSQLTCRNRVAWKRSTNTFRGLWSWYGSICHAATFDFFWHNWVPQNVGANEFVSLWQWSSNWKKNVFICVIRCTQTKFDKIILTHRSNTTITSYRFRVESVWSADLRHFILNFGPKPGFDCTIFFSHGVHSFFWSFHWDIYFRKNKLAFEHIFENLSSGFSANYNVRSKSDDCWLIDCDARLSMFFQVQLRAPLMRFPLPLGRSTHTRRFCELVCVCVRTELVLALSLSCSISHALSLSLALFLHTYVVDGDVSVAFRSTEWEYTYECLHVYVCVIVCGVHSLFRTINIKP